jgi:hypothetical protein
LRKVALFLPAKVSSKLSFSGKTCLTDGSQLEANPDCALPWFHALISWNGDVGICAQHPKLGNLREQSFEEIYAGARCSGPPWTPVRRTVATMLTTSPPRRRPSRRSWSALIKPFQPN